MGWYVYMLRCADGSYYTGSTTDVARRFAQHQSGRGAKYTRSHPPVAVAYQEPAADKSAAFRREAAIKNMTHRQKQELERRWKEANMQEIRRQDRALTEEEAWAVVDECTYGVLTVVTEEGPYGAPVNFVRRGGELYFHCALTGRKTSALRGDPRVCFTCVGDDEVVGEHLTTRYRCAMVFGTAEEITGEAEKWAALELLCRRLAPQHMDVLEAHRPSLPRTAVWKLTAERITGKANRK